MQHLTATVVTCCASIAFVFPHLFTFLQVNRVVNVVEHHGCSEKQSFCIVSEETDESMWEVQNTKTSSSSFSIFIVLKKEEFFILL